MKTATVRQIQHHLTSVLRWIEDGHEVRITRRGRIVAKMVPARDDPQIPAWPDFVHRSESIWGKESRGKPVSRIIIDERGDRL